MQLGSCDHGFQISTPAEVFDGNPHTIRIFASDTEGGPDRELSGSPQTVTCTPGMDAGTVGGNDAGPANGTGGSSMLPVGSAGASPGGPGNQTRTLDGGGCSVRPGPAERHALAWLLSLGAIALFRRRQLSKIFSI